eukprot:gb/GEZN01012406.1/.p1 GENE.gb/GEZN01012406.1/~~gb/GEZN01012406.1/.p1  ORF type:complete len:292 (+),score=30.00 gb/GEZN01012406.1/:69-944(+)
MTSQQENKGTATEPLLPRGPMATTGSALGDRSSPIAVAAWVQSAEDEELWGEGLGYAGAPLDSKAALQGFLKAKRDQREEGLRIDVGVPGTGRLVRKVVAGHVSMNPLSSYRAYQFEADNGRLEELDAVTGWAISCMLCLSLFVFFATVVVNVWFISIGSENLNNPNSYCRQLASWFFVFGIVQLASLFTRIGHAWYHGRNLSSEAMLRHRDLDSLSIAAATNFFTLIWSVYAILLLSFGPDKAGDCADELWYPLYFIYVILVPAIFFAMFCSICFLAMAETSRVVSYYDN